MMQIPQIQNIADFSHSANKVIIRTGDLLFGLNESSLSADLYAQVSGQVQAYSARGIKSIESILTAEGEIYHSPIDESKGLDFKEQLKITTSKIYKHAQNRKVEQLGFAFSDISPEYLFAAIEGLFYAQYDFTIYKSKSEPKSPTQVDIFLPAHLIEMANEQITKALVLAEATTAIRDFVNTPGGDLIPSDYAERIQDLFQNLANIQIEILDETTLEEQAYMGLITVGRGSQNSPRMVSISYTPKQSNGPHLGFVGKGMTFDAGGISIKPATGMWEMRMDMAGSAAVVGAMYAIAKLQIPVQISAVLCLAENRPGENACLPGDIFKAKNGKTVMVDNTDAEGRLVLSDGLYKVGEMGATTIIDLATLTGAIIRAIGTSITGLFSNDDELASNLIQAGKNCGEKLWQLPLEMEYRESFDDKVADMKNIGGDAGAVTAALFLQEFIPNHAKWAHLDIAGTAFTTKDWKYYGCGATGWGVRTLVEFAIQQTGEKK